MQVEIPNAVIKKWKELVEICDESEKRGCVVTTEQLAKYYNTTPPTISAAIQTGRLPFGFATKGGRTVATVLAFFAFEMNGIEALKNAKPTDVLPIA